MRFFICTLLFTSLICFDSIEASNRRGSTYSEVTFNGVTYRSNQSTSFSVVGNQIFWHTGRPSTSGSPASTSTGSPSSCSSGSPASCSSGSPESSPSSSQASSTTSSPARSPPRTDPLPSSGETSRTQRNQRPNFRDNDTVHTKRDTKVGIFRDGVPYEINPTGANGEAKRLKLKGGYKAKRGDNAIAIYKNRKWRNFIEGN